MPKDMEYFHKVINSTHQYFRNWIVRYVGIDFMGPFPQSFGNFYILMIVDYVSKWIEAITTPTNDTKVVTIFSFNFVSRHDTPITIINNDGTHFCNKHFEDLMNKYRVKRNVVIAYHPQRNVQGELFNKAMWDIGSNSSMFEG